MYLDNVIVAYRLKLEMIINLPKQTSPEINVDDLIKVAERNEFIDIKTIINEQKICSQDLGKIFAILINNDQPSPFSNSREIIRSIEYQERNRLTICF